MHTNRMVIHEYGVARVAYQLRMDNVTGFLKNGGENREEEITIVA